MPNNAKNFVISSTPLRVSFAGGGTDFYDYYSKHEGALVSSTIDKDIKVTVKRHNEIFKEGFRINYSKSEIENNLENIKNDIARECIRLVGINYPLYISTISDLPDKSGLGSSSSFCVGLLNALFNLEGKKISSEELFQASIEIEINILKKPIGIQDQMAAVFGGLNFYKINKNGNLDINRFEDNSGYVINNLFKNLILIWTSIQRNSSDILNEQEKNISKNISNLHFIKNLAFEFWDLINNKPNAEKVGNLLESGWLKKVNLASKINNKEVTDLYQKCKSLGAYGGKLSGAGGGGFLLMSLEEKKIKNLIEGLNNYNKININYNPNGSRILFSE